MNDREKMEVLLRGETLEHDKGVTVKLKKEYFILNGYASNEPARTFVLSDNWKIKPKKVTITRNDLARVWEKYNSFNGFCEGLGL